MSGVFLNLGMNDLNRACMRCVCKSGLFFFFFGGGVRPTDAQKKSVCLILLLYHKCVLGIAVFTCYFCNRKAKFSVIHRK